VITEDRGSPELQTQKFRTGIFKIDCVGEQLFCGSGVALEHQIMVSGNNDLESVWLLA
jgi:hypothetical protein